MTEAVRDALRRAREHAGLSLRSLGGRVNYSHDYLHQIEHGERQIGPDPARRLDAALDTAGALEALATDSGRAPMPVQEPHRLSQVLRYPGKLDAGAVDAIAGRSRRRSAEPRRARRP